jgi:hypothetical protein
MAREDAQDDSYTATQGISAASVKSLGAAAAFFSVGNFSFQSDVAGHCSIVSASARSWNRKDRHSDDKRRRGELSLQAALLRDIFGNPFQPVVLDPRLLTENVLALARTIYDERVFDRMPSKPPNAE